MKSETNFINVASSSQRLFSWVFCMVIWVVGLLNLFWVHPVPAIIYFLLSLVYLPPANDMIKKRFGLLVPFAVKFILAISITMFTLGVSDLGDMIDNWNNDNFNND